MSLKRFKNISEKVGYLSAFPSGPKPEVDPAIELKLKKDLADFESDIATVLEKYKEQFKDRKDTRFLIGTKQIMNNWKSLLKI